MFEWDTQTAHEALPTMDAAVFVLTADPPVSAAERDLLGRVAGLSATTFTVLNEADHLDQPGLAEALKFTGRVLDCAERPGRVYPMSARAALDSGDPGFAAFRAEFTAYLASRRHSDLRASAIALAHRIASPLADEVTLARRAAEMRAGNAAAQVGQFTARLAEVTVRGRDGVVVAESGLTVLTAAAESVLSFLATCRTAVDDYAARVYQMDAAFITRVIYRSRSAGGS